MDNLRGLLGIRRMLCSGELCGLMKVFSGGENDKTAKRVCAGSRSVNLVAEEVD